MSGDNLKKKTVKGLYWSFLGQFTNYAVQFIVGIVMARMLTPEDYGITAIPAIFMSIALIFIESGFSSALVRKEYLTEHDLTTAFIYSSLVGLTCYLLLFFAAPLIATFYNIPVLIPLIRISALTFLWGPLVTPQNVILQRKLDFKTPARITIINRVISGLLGIYTAYIGYGLWALVITNLSSSLIGLIQTWWAVKWIPRKKWSKESFRYLWGYGNKLVGSSLIESIFSNLGAFLIGKIAGTFDLGNFNRAKQYAMIPSTNVMNVLNSVTFPVLSKMQDDDERLGINYRKMIRVSAFLLFPIMLLLASLARPLVIVMLTEKWESCIILLQILCFVFMWQPIQILNINLLSVKGRPDLVLRLRMIIKPLAALITISALFFGIVYFCLAELLVQLLALFLNTYYTGKMINVGYMRQMKDILPSFLLAITMFGIVLFVNSLFDSFYLQIFVGGLVGCLFYLCVSILLRFEELKEVKNLICVDLFRK